ncbi:hypothetical protein B9Q06_08255 [Candidatus Marsarchaeota G2 archaeon ECH_B_2]|uniref:Uncharacterized protein n=3 Tax=Candidatus Marsarchaeota group 2 TaxID=2203771 RepID=A0A2R6B823_9ARCH|nr:MAG: hypothetical protein B9Q06_08255 [Candidatus Marsarchaeota G2 archaeon ECH_B_2]PSN97355.1 MAG: hypothetical protein B9Q07_12210 [Candidatus Marsarchaeota G2 archaeon ECH_B_3]PSO03103.1 MAG: hypothetical protein B9Q05_01815 [Candidatus Marsarchaeota G2 archaeon ECH_B_1]
MSELIKVSKDVKKKLLRIAGELQSERGEKISLSEAINFLISCYEGKNSNTKTRIIESLSHLITDLGKSQSDDIDKTIYDAAIDSS